MPKLEKFKEPIQDADLPDFDLSIEDIRRRGSTVEHLRATMNEVLQILDNTTDCLTVKDLHARFVEGFPRDGQRFARFQNFMAGFNMFLLESAVKFLAQQGYVQLEPNLSKNASLKNRMILGCQENLQVGIILDDDEGGFWMGPTNGPNCVIQWSSPTIMLKRTQQHQKVLIES